MDFRTLSLLALAIGPAIAIMAFVYARDVRPRTIRRSADEFFWGVSGVVPAIILETMLPGLVPGSSGSGIPVPLPFILFVIIAFSEEFSKYIFLRYYSYRSVLS